MPPRQSKAARPVFDAASALGVAVRLGAEPEKIAELRRDLRAAQLEKAVKEAVEKFPPLTPEQVDRIAAILRSTTSDAA